MYHFDHRSALVHFLVSLFFAFTYFVEGESMGGSGDDDGRNQVICVTGDRISV